MALVNPKSEEETYMMSIYTIGSAMSLILLYLDYKKKYKTAYFMLIYVFVRLGLRMLDLENTKTIMTDS